MTKTDAAVVNWAQAIMLCASMGGAFWAVVMRCAVTDGAPPAGTILGVVAFITLILGSIGALVYRLTPRATAGIGIALAPLTGWVAILIYIIV
ncbi:hypothetical protein [Mycobacteroides abscessus]|uniref:hypothetical protein n=1 Tax=Mycobacteroides abscessus TaxID=36809 RepID=UPI00092ACEAB|nr:hypothetical protein [Mycobacteroides abscessus]MBE5462783.1 hypothetical protein [Mycobacteroides abscessus]QOF41034.1 hypothetical protein E3G69_000043 [Mycobacteroides abscessus]QOF45734.1 hypothetical protein E3G70_000043 [Mycobacteroides abscessus]SIJ32914.1 Uncharacterised protein [Mycobacteroides abscessus subsp. bolletii]